VNDKPSWCASSPYHFYCSRKFPALHVTSWDKGEILSTDNFTLCGPCFEDALQDTEYRKARQRLLPPLRTLDLCAGVGGLGHGLERSGALKVTYAIEINYEACRTLQ
jgi:hypothetical protein